MNHFLMKEKLACTFHIDMNVVNKDVTATNLSLHNIDTIITCSKIYSGNLISSWHSTEELQKYTIVLHMHAYCISNKSHIHENKMVT